jgi:hypothetical protein
LEFSSYDDILIDTRCCTKIYQGELRTMSATILLQPYDHMK